MKVCILKPRLDCMFKKGHVPDKVGPTPPHRQPFENFVNKVVEEYTFRGDETWVVEKPLWQMSPDDVKEIDADITFVPHKEPVYYTHLRAHQTTEDMLWRLLI